MDAVHYVAELANCTHEQAEQALRLHGSVLEAIDSLIVIPGVSGDKYIPKTKTVSFADNDPEQAERCARGRKLMDSLSAVSSAAQSKARTQSLLEGVAEQEPSEEKPEEKPEDESPSTTAPSQDSPEKTSQPSEIYVQLP